MATPLHIWQENKEYLEQQLAIISDATQKVALRKQIEECDTEIAKLSNQSQHPFISQNPLQTQNIIVNKLLGQELKQLHKALLDAFVLESLAQMLKFKLDKDLHNITTASGFSNITFQLITTANKEGWIGKLIEAAHQENKGNEELSDFYKTIFRVKEHSPIEKNCPYKGLAAFTKEDKEIFFGRENYKRELLKAVENRNFTSVIGASGSGKSSLVQAGLIAELNNSEWSISSFRPGKYPFSSLATAIVSLLNPDITKENLSLKSSKFSQRFKKKNDKKNFIFPLS